MKRSEATATGLITKGRAPAGRPSIWRRLWAGWKAAGRHLGVFQARVVLTLCYFLVIPPFAGLVQWTTDPLAIKPATARGWRDRQEPPGTGLERARRQY